MMENFPDKELLTAADAQTAFAIIYDRYWEPLYKKALTRFGNDADAQDAVQVVFISLWKNKDTVEASNTLAPYLFAALKYPIIKKVYRKAKKGAHLALSVSRLEECGGYEENQFQLKELQSALLRELDNLPAKIRRQQIIRSVCIPTSPPKDMR